MSLIKKQFKFTYAVSFLIKYAFENGYFLTFGDCYRDSRCKYGHPNSNHRKRLAVDFNLFVKDENGVHEYITDGKHPAWKDLRQEWERLGGSKAIKKDMNHFSFLHNGQR